MRFTLLLAGSCLMFASCRHWKDYHDISSEAIGNEWLANQSAARTYIMRLDSEVIHSGRYAAMIQSATDSVDDFSTFVSKLPRGSYLGKKVRMSAWVKAENIIGWAGLWMRVDGVSNSQIPESNLFDNMHDRPIQGTSDWTEYSITLDVPEKATNVYFGILLDGTGKVWADDFNFTVVDTLPTSSAINERSKSIKPLKELGFEIRQ